MKNKNIIAIAVVLIVLAAAGVGVYLYKKRKKKEGAKETQKSIQNAPAQKPYDNEFKRLADTFFNTSELGPEQEAALYDDMQKRFMANGEGKVDAFVAAVSNWMPAWLEDSALAEKKSKIEAAWSNLYKEWSILRAKSFKS